MQGRRGAGRAPQLRLDRIARNERGSSSGECGKSLSPSAGAVPLIQSPRARRSRLSEWPGQGGGLCRSLLPVRGGLGRWALPIAIPFLRGTAGSVAVTGQGGCVAVIRPG